MTSRQLLLTTLITLLLTFNLHSEPGFNGSSPGCSGSGCHSFLDNTVSVVPISNLQVQVTVAGTSSKVGGELVDDNGNVVAVINSTTNNPFILTAPSEGTYLVNAGFKNPSPRRWDSTHVTLQLSLPPDAPTNLTATAVSQTQIDLNWQDNSNNEDGFKIERRLPPSTTWTEIATLGANTTSYNNTGLTLNTNYCYQVRAYNAVGNSSYSNEACATTNPNVPNPPSNLVAQFIPSPLSVQLTWTDNSNNEDGFIIEREGLGPEAFVIVDTVSANSTIYLDTTVTYLTYVYRLTAFNISGQSAYSDTAQIVVPVELTFFNASIKNEGVLLEWTTATEINNMGFEIQRNQSVEWETIGFVEGRGTTSEITNYQFFNDLSEFNSSAKLQYRLKQIDFNGVFSYSNTVEVDFLVEKYSLSQNYPNPFNPSTSISFTLTTKTFVTLKVYNILGNEITTLVNELIPGGNHKVKFDATGLPSGVYLYSLNAGDFVETKKMLLMK